MTLTPKIEPTEQKKPFLKVFIGTFRLMHFLPVITVTTIALIVSLITIKGDNNFVEFYITLQTGGIDLYIPFIFLVLTVFFQEAFCGIQNDYLDQEVDKLYNKRKAIPDGWVSSRFAFWSAIICFILFTGCSIVVSFWANIGFWSILFVQAANLIGIFYNMYAKNKPISIVPYFLGFPLIPTYVWLVLGGFQTKFLWILPILFFVSFPAHIANELPDVEYDIKYKKRNFAVFLGEKWSTIIYWLGIFLNMIVIITVFLIYQLNLLTFILVLLLSCITASIALFFLWKKNWRTDLIVFDIVTACIGIQTIGFFILLAV